MTEFDCTNIVDEIVANIVDVPTTKNCSNVNCKNINPQPYSNFANNKNASDGKSWYCKDCNKEQKQELKDRQNTISWLKENDLDGFKTTLACLYVNLSHTTKSPTKRLLKDFQLTNQELIDILIEEQLYEYKLCFKCGKLKSFTEYFKKGKLCFQENCKLCVVDIRSKDEHALQYKKDMRKRPVNYNKYSPKLFADECRESENFPDILEVKCTYCGKWFTPNYGQVDARIQSISENAKSVDRRLYCSDKCKHQCPIFRKSAERMMLEDIDTEIPLNREVQAQLRQMVLARDNYTCQRCGKHQDDLDVGLHAHHIEGVRWNPIESADIDQVITVCVDCHKIIHKIPGCTTYDMRCSVIDMDKDTLNKIKKNKEIKKQVIDKEINISNKLLEDFLLD